MKFTPHHKDTNNSRQTLRAFVYGAGFIFWHYTAGVKKLLEIWQDFLIFFWKFFSPGRHLKTLFSPWKRDISKVGRRGLHPVLWLQSAGGKRGDSLYRSHSKKLCCWCRDFRADIIDCLRCFFSSDLAGIANFFVGDFLCVLRIFFKRLSGCVFLDLHFFILNPDFAFLQEAFFRFKKELSRDEP